MQPYRRLLSSTLSRKCIREQLISQRDRFSGKAAGRVPRTDKNGSISSSSTMGTCSFNTKTVSLSHRRRRVTAGHTRSRCTDPYRGDTHTTLRSVKVAASAFVNERCNLVLVRFFVLGNAAEGNFSCF